jgi:hypothetical protein
MFPAAFVFAMVPPRLTCPSTLREIAYPAPLIVTVEDALKDPALVTVRPPSAVVPTVFWNATAPVPALRLSVCVFATAAFTVPTNVMFAFVVVIVVLAPKITFPLYVWIPVVVTTPPLIPVVRLTVTDVKGVKPPTAPLNTAAPVIASVQPLSSVPPKVTTVPVSAAFAPKVAAPV